MYFNFLLSFFKKLDFAVVKNPSNLHQNGASNHQFSHEDISKTTGPIFRAAGALRPRAGRVPR